MVLVEAVAIGEGGDMLTRPWLLATIASGPLSGEAAAQGQLDAEA